MTNNKLAKLVDELSNLNVLETVELSKLLEEHWGVSAAPVAVAAGPQSAAAAAVEEKTEFNVVITDVGAKKIDVIKALREVTKQGLSECKAITEGAMPYTVKQGASKEEADKLVELFKAAGATAKSE